MSVGAVSSIVGTAGSLISGSKSDKAASKANKLAAKQYEKNQQISRELKDRWNVLVEPALKAQMEEANSQGLSTSARLAEDELLGGIGKIRTKVLNNADTQGTGLTDAKLLNLDLTEATGRSKIRLSDELQKKTDQRSLMSFAAQTPSWAQVATNSNSNSGAFYEQQAVANQQAANSAYGVAAQGLAQLGRLYGRDSGYGQEGIYYAPITSGGRQIQE